MMPTCEQISEWPDGHPPRVCGKVAVRRFAGAAGGYAYLCLHHAKFVGTSRTEACYAGEDASPLDEPGSLGTPSTESGE